MLKLWVVVGLVAVGPALAGCGPLGPGAAFTVETAVQVSGDGGAGPPSAETGLPEEAQAGHDLNEAGLGDAGPEAAVLDVTPPKEDAGDAGPAVNLFPGSPYGPAMCRGGADCVSDTRWDVDGGSPVTLVCIAQVGGPASLSGPSSPGPSPNELTGTTLCGPAEDENGSPILCLSDLDCGGYSCITKQCSVAIYESYDSGNVDPTGVEPVLVSYCQGVGNPPAGCN